MNFLLSGKPPQRNGNAHPNIQPQDVYRCADGDLILVVGNDRQFAHLCDVLGQPQWAADERFATNAQRVRNIVELSALLQAEFGVRRRGDCVSALEQAGVPAGAINNLQEVFQDPQVVHRGMLAQVAHPSGVNVPQLRSPIRYEEAAMDVAAAPPLMGQHGDDILAGLGYAPADIAALRAAGVV